ncbi:tetratricopeptide repeat protein, partial [Pseudomonadota bacterium]
MGSDARRKADAHHKMGIMRYRQGILQAAIHQLRAALSVDPAHEPSYAALAAIYIEMRFWDEALDVCRQGLQRCKQRAQLHKLTIDALGLRGSLADAFAHYQL